MANLFFLFLSLFGEFLATLIEPIYLDYKTWPVTGHESMGYLNVCLGILCKQVGFSRDWSGLVRLRVDVSSVDSSRARRGLSQSLILPTI